MDIHEPERRRSYVVTLLVIGLFAFGAWWAVVHLFPVELQQIGHWLQSTYQSLRD